MNRPNLTIGQRAVLQSSARLALGELSIEGIDKSGVVVARFTLASASADSTEQQLLRELAEACDCLAFAVVAEREKDLQQLGLYVDFEDDLDALRLGLDFVALAVTDDGQYISFKVLNAPAARSDD